MRGPRRWRRSRARRPGRAREQGARPADGTTGPVPRSEAKPSEAESLRSERRAKRAARAWPERSSPGRPSGAATSSARADPRREGVEHALARGLTLLGVELDGEQILVGDGRRERA